MSSILSDRTNLITDENECPPPSYQSTIHHDANSYGTFVDNIHESLLTTAATPYPYALGSSLSPTVIILGGCPACKVGMLENDFTCFGLCCAIFFFPIGLLCCFAFRQRRCNFCGAIFD